MRASCVHVGGTRQLPPLLHSRHHREPSVPVLVLLRLQQPVLLLADNRVFSREPGKQRARARRR